MKMYIDFAEKEVEFEGTASEIQTMLDIIVERCPTFGAHVTKRKTMSSADLFKKMMEEL